MFLLHGRRINLHKIAISVLKLNNIPPSVISLNIQNELCFQEIIMLSMLKKMSKKEWTKSFLASEMWKAVLLNYYEYYYNVL